MAQALQEYDRLVVFDHAVGSGGSSQVRLTCNNNLRLELPITVLALCDEACVP